MHKCLIFVKKKDELGGFLIVQFPNWNWLTQHKWRNGEMTVNTKQSIRQKEKIGSPFLNDAKYKCFANSNRANECKCDETLTWISHYTYFILFYLHFGWYRQPKHKNTVPYCVGVSALQIDIGYELRAGCKSAYWWWQQYL